MAICSCCGEDREHLAALLCHPEVAICKMCLGWLAASLPDTIEATPVLSVPDLDAAEAFWAAVGQEVERWSGGGYAFVGDDGEVVHLGEDPDGGPPSCILVVSDVDDWHRRWDDAGYGPGPVEDMPYGMREFSITDTGGNRVRICTPISA